MDKLVNEGLFDYTNILSRNESFSISSKNEIINYLKTLESLINKARNEKLLLYDEFLKIWFTPNGIIDYYNNIEYIMCKTKWELRGHNDILNSLYEKKEIIQLEINKIENYIKN